MEVWQRLRGNARLSAIDLLTVGEVVKGHWDFMKFNLVGG